jgi:hypothetical protein
MICPRGRRAVFRPTLSQKNIDLYIESDYRCRRTVIFTLGLATHICLYKAVEPTLPKWPALTVVICAALVLLYAAVMARYVWRPLRARRNLLAMQDVVLVPAGSAIDTFCVEQNARITEEVEDEHQLGLRMQLFHTAMELLRIYRALQYLDFDMEALHRLNAEQRAAQRGMVDTIDRYARPTLP